jgi:hypothetical protein
MPVSLIAFIILTVLLFFGTSIVYSGLKIKVPKPPINVDLPRPEVNVPIPDNLKTVIPPPKVEIPPKVDTP